MPRSPGRGGHAWRQLRVTVLSTEDTCHLCHKPVDKSLPGTHPWGPTVDHVIPLRYGGAPLDRRNCRLSHRWCNTSRGDGTRRTQGGRHTSEDW